MRRVAIGHTFDEFREIARALLAAEVAPDDVAFEERDETQPGLLGVAAEPLPPPTDPNTKPASVPRAFVELAEIVAAHRAPERWALLYRALHRITHGEHALLEHALDPVTLALFRLQKSVLRDVHKTHAFVRFRKVVDAQDIEHWIAWHEPQHRSLALAAPHFARRFATMRWSILTPDATVDWDLETLHFGPGVTKAAAPSSDVLEDLWRTYYASIFNPARLNVRAMRQELPRRHWKTLPEAELISQLVREAPARTEQMTVAPLPSLSVAQIPRDGDLPTLREAARDCRLCPWAHQATQTVFGEGPARAPIMLVGEQPGDQEDLQGRPFVGPAGEWLDRILREVELPRDALYITNAVKHFKFEPRGKRRIHQRPTQEDIKTCRGWLEAEVARVQPQIIVALGATAGQSFLGAKFRISRSRGAFLTTPWTSQFLATWHPSAILRASTEDEREKIIADLHSDLRLVAQAWRELQRS